MRLVLFTLIGIALIVWLDGYKPEVTVIARPVLEAAVAENLGKYAVIQVKKYGRFGLCGQPTMLIGTDQEAKQGMFPDLQIAEVLNRETYKSRQLEQKYGRIFVIAEGMVWRMIDLDEVAAEGEESPEPLDLIGELTGHIGGCATVTGTPEEQRLKHEVCSLAQAAFLEGEMHLIQEQTKRQQPTFTGQLPTTTDPQWPTVNARPQQPMWFIFTIRDGVVKEEPQPKPQKTWTERINENYRRVTGEKLPAVEMRINGVPMHWPHFRRW